MGSTIVKRKWPVELTVEAGFAMALIVAGAIGVLLYRSTAGLIDNSLSLVRTHEVLQGIESAMAAVTEAETASRGYLLSGDDAYLTGYSNAISDVPALIRGVREATVEDERRSRLAAQLEIDVAAKLRFYSEIIEARRASGKQASPSFFSEGESKRLTDKVRSVVDEMRVEERRLLNGRVEAWKESRRNAILGFTVLTLASICVFFLVYFLFHRDLRRRRVTELALAESKNWLELVLESDTAVSIIATGASGLVTVFNTGAVKMLGYTPSDVIGRTTLATFHLDSEIEAWGREGPGAPDPAVHGFGVIEKRLRECGRDEREWTYVRKDGSHLTVNLAITPIRDGEGQVVGFLAIARDVTESRRLARELSLKNEELEVKNRQVLEASRLKSEFLANMSHELRTPLNGIIGFSELIQDGQAGPVTESQQEFLGDILTSSRHLLHLINEVLDLAKVEAGKTEFRPEPIIATDLIGEVRDVLRPLASEKGIVIEVEVDPDVDNLVLDPSKLKQVLYNYLSNALKFTPHGGSVWVRVLPENSVSVRLEVKDTGIGIPARHIGRLFEEFQQIDPVPGQHQGTGLGLALTKRLVEAQGGQVGVSSEHGVGSVFHAVLLRVARGDVADPGKLEGRVRKAIVDIPPQRKPALLVIEDNSADRSFLVTTLSGAGYSVETAASVEEAIVKCGRTLYDAITLGLLLSDTNGWEVLRAIRKSGPNQATPVIVVTVVAEKAINVGFQVQDVLTKPVQASDLLASLSSAGVGASAGRTILVVDDDPAALKLMEITLARLEYRALCCASAEEGLAAAAASKPAAIILDLLMPGMNGIEFLRRFRQTEGGRNTPVIIWTNKDLSSREKSEIDDLAEGLAFKKHGGTTDVLEELRACLEAGGVERVGGNPR